MEAVPLSKGDLVLHLSTLFLVGKVSACVHLINPAQVLPPTLTLNLTLTLVTLTLTLTNPGHPPSP